MAYVSDLYRRLGLSQLQVQPRPISGSGISLCSIPLWFPHSAPVEGRPQFSSTEYPANPSVLSQLSRELVGSYQLCIQLCPTAKASYVCSWSGWTPTLQVWRGISPGLPFLHNYLKDKKLKEWRKMQYMQIYLCHKNIYMNMISSRYNRHLIDIWINTVGQ